MKKITPKLWIYATNFLIRSITFNVALAFAITALVFLRDGLTIWAIIAIGLASGWFLLNLFGHLIWRVLKVQERALYFAIRKHGANVVELTRDEVERKTGQPDIHEIFTDTDSGLEIKMIVNGAGTFVNVFIGVKWFIHARIFNKDSSVFQWHISESK